MARLPPAADYTRTTTTSDAPCAAGPPGKPCGAGRGRVRARGACRAGLALLLAWFVVRILWGYTSSFFFWLDTLAAYREASIRTPVMAWYMVANVSLNLLNTVWFFKIVKGAVKALSGGRK